MTLCPELHASLNISEALLHTLTHCVVDPTDGATPYCPLHPHPHMCCPLFVCLFVCLCHWCMCCFVCLFTSCHSWQCRQDSTVHPKSVHFTQFYITRHMEEHHHWEY